MSFNISTWPARICSRCHRPVPSSSKLILLPKNHVKGRNDLRYSSSSVTDYNSTFEDYDRELLKRKRKADAKRRQRGSDFVDHLIVTVRGGKGGSGAAAFTSHTRGSLIPSGGNGGSGGSVYINTNPHITSLSRLSKRIIGDQGDNGAGNYRNGKRGKDLIVDVPVGTVIRELNREGEFEKGEREDESIGLGIGMMKKSAKGKGKEKGKEDDRSEMRRWEDEDKVDEMIKDLKKRKKWERLFINHPSGQSSPEEYFHGEEILRKEGFFKSLSSINEIEPIDLDISQALPQPLLLSKGGKGGLGNPYFTRPDSPPPRIASRGTSPPTLTLEFELKLLADIGLVGLPNVGKSTILRSLTGKKAEVAGYEFTTLNPQVGVCRVFENGEWKGEEGVLEESEIVRNKEVENREKGVYQPTIKEQRQNRSKSKIEVDHGTEIGLEGGAHQRGSERGREIIRFTISDNPGLLEKASENKGLGHSFLRSIERSLALVYVLNLASTSTPVNDLRVLKDELEAYKEGLSEKAVLIVLNKGDQVDEAEGKSRITAVTEQLKDWGRGDVEIVVVSAKFGLGMKKVVEILSRRIEEERRKDIDMDQTYDIPDEVE